MKKQMMNIAATGNQSMLDVTGQNMQKPHGKSSAYLNNASSMVELR